MSTDPREAMAEQLARQTTDIVLKLMSLGGELDRDDLPNHFGPKEMCNIILFETACESLKKSGDTSLTDMSPIVFTETCIKVNPTIVTKLCQRALNEYTPECWRLIRMAKGNEGILNLYTQPFIPETAEAVTLLKLSSAISIADGSLTITLTHIGRLYLDMYEKEQKDVQAV